MPETVSVVDSDGHLVEPPVVWEEYTDAAFRDLVIQVRAYRQRARGAVYRGPLVRLESGTDVPSGSVQRSGHRRDVGRPAPGRLRPGRPPRGAGRGGLRAGGVLPVDLPPVGRHRRSGCCRRKRSRLQPMGRRLLLRRPARLFAFGVAPLQDVVRRSGRSNEWRPRTARRHDPAGALSRLGRRHPRVRAVWAAAQGP